MVYQFRGIPLGFDNIDLVWLAVKVSRFLLLLRIFDFERRIHPSIYSESREILFLTPAFLAPIFSDGSSRF